MKNILRAKSRLSGAVKRSAVLLISTALSLPASFLGPANAASHTAIDRNSLAAEYAQALRDVGNVGSMSIRSEEDAKKAIAVVKAARGKLRRGRFSYLVMTLANNSAFKQAVTSRLRTEEAKPQNAKLSRLEIGKTFYRTNIGLNKSGFASSDLGRQGIAALRSQAKTDAGIFQRAGKNLKESLAKLKLTSHADLESERSPVAFRRVGYAVYSSGQVTVLADELEAAASPVQGGLIEAAIIGGAVLLIGAYFNAKIEDVTEEDNPDPDGGERTDFEKCMDEADSKIDSCRNKCKKDDWICEGFCSAEWYFSMGLCVTLPQ